MDNHNNIGEADVMMDTDEYHGAQTSSGAPPGIAGPAGAAGATALPQAGGRRITLEVGEERFLTTIETLSGQSAYFRALISEHISKNPEGTTIFIDVDPKLFSYVLRYLRHGVFPLIYDSTHGHDYGTYSGILQLARLFKIDKLKRWLEQCRYYYPIKVQVAHRNSTLGLTDEIPHHDYDSCVSHQIQFFPGTRDVYNCPRRIPDHTAPGLCNTLCRNAATPPGAEEWEVEEVLRAQTVTMFAEYNHELCIDSQENDELDKDV